MINIRHSGGSPGGKIEAPEGGPREEFAMSARRSPHAPWRRIFSPPETRLGWWAVGLAATFVIFLILGYGGLAVPAYGVVLLLCGLCGGGVWATGGGRGGGRP